MSARGLRRWWQGRADRCEGCGHPFRRRGDARHSFGNGDRRVYHGPCLGLVVWRRKADERLRVLALAMDVGGIVPADVQEVAELRAASDVERAHLGTEVWRVLYDLGREVSR